MTLLPFAFVSTKLRVSKTDLSLFNNIKLICLSTCKIHNEFFFSIFLFRIYTYGEIFGTQQRIRTTESNLFVSIQSVHTSAIILLFHVGPFFNLKIIPAAKASKSLNNLRLLFEQCGNFIFHFPLQFPVESVNLKMRI